MSIENGNITSSVYTKPFTGNSLLRADSCHPRYLNGVIKRGQFCACAEIAILEPGIQVVASRAPTLGMTLAPSMFNKELRSEIWLDSLGMFRCGSTRCVTCQVVRVSRTFVCSVTQEIHQIGSYINCNRKSVDYLITCLKCQKQYVGCTIRNLKNRIRGYLNTLIVLDLGMRIAQDQDTSTDATGGQIKQISVQGIERVTLGPRGGDLQAKLLRAELKWIYKLYTRQPEGLNSVFDISCYF
ncbi:hypothetical protein XELAEV_18031788mg [Xenopus laevis]|uniref:Uncharacterized protein n=1 Tax=Xenopus laevis TaxID=8355 RepID=A0A974CN80_XENLA|nr:hypothetical protein XELAEV_18031788mg [Xenopus laevis]